MPGRPTSGRRSYGRNARSSRTQRPPTPHLIDGQNRRIGKKVNGVLVQAFLYSSQLRPAAELDGAGNVVSRFIYGTRINVPDYMVKGGATYRLLTDQLGSVRFVLDSATGVVA